MRQLFLLISLLASMYANAATTATVIERTWDLYRGTSIRQSGFVSQSACVEAAKALNITANYTCRTLSLIHI